MPLGTKGGVEVLVILSDIKRSEEMAALYQKVELIAKAQVSGETIAEVMERLDSIRAKLWNLNGSTEEARYSRWKIRLNY